MDGTDTTVLCDPDDMDRQYVVKKDEQKMSYSTCGPHLIITCLVVQAVAFGICLIVLIAYVSNANRPIANIMSQADSQMLQEGQMTSAKEAIDTLTSELTSSKDAIETLTNQLVEAMATVKSNEEKIQRLMSSSNESRVSTCGIL